MGQKPPDEDTAMLIKETLSIEKQIAKDLENLLREIAL